MPGGVTEPLAAAKRDEILAMIPEAYAQHQAGARRVQADRRQLHGRRSKSSPTSRPSTWASSTKTSPSSSPTALCASSIPKGNIIEDGITATRFTEVIGEAVEPYSYTKFAYYKPLGYPEGSYRVGPLARLNIAKTMGTPLADEELAEFKQLATGPVESSFHYHHARLIDILYGIEKIEQILTDPLHPRQARARHRRRQSP